MRSNDAFTTLHVPGEMPFLGPGPATQSSIHELSEMRLGFTDATSKESFCAIASCERRTITLENVVTFRIWCALQQPLVCVLQFKNTSSEAPSTILVPRRTCSVRRRNEIVNSCVRHSERVRGNTSTGRDLAMTRSIRLTAYRAGPASNASGRQPAATR